MSEADILPYEKVQVLNLNNGTRIETYTIPGKPGSGEVILNGPAVRWGEPGDQVLILSYAEFNEDELEGYRPKILLVNEQNKVERVLALRA